MGYIYGKLNKEIERVALGGGETPTSTVRIEDNIIYVDHKADRVFDPTSDRPVQNKTLTNKFGEMDASLLHMKESFEEQWALIRHMHNVVEEQVKLVAQYNQDSIERDADLLSKIVAVKAELERDIVALANFIVRYEEELSHLKAVDKANEEAIAALRSAYEIKMEELDATDESIRTDISNFKTVYNEAVNAFTNEDIRINSRIDDLTAAYNQKMTELDTKDADIVQSIVDAIAQHNQDISNLLDKHNSDIADVRKEHSDSISEITNKHNQDIAEIASKHNTDLSELTDSMTNTISQLESKHDSQISDMTNRYDTKIAEVEASHNSDVEGINKSISDLDDKYQSKVEELLDADESNSTALITHNNSETAHEYIRGLIADLDSRLDAFLGDEDAATALSDLLDYLQTNGDLISSLDANKINYTDIVDNLTTEDSTKPLSAKQGKVLNDAISEMSTNLSEVYDVKIGELEEADTKINGSIESLQEMDETLDYEIKVVKSSVAELSDTVYNELGTLLAIDFIVGGTAPITDD